MPVLAQAGYGRGDKVHKALDAGCISGIILSPKDERRGRLEDCARELRATHPFSTILFDPQFYVSALADPRDGRLPEYEYYLVNSGLARTQFGPRQVQKYVSDCLGYQVNLGGLSYLISPSVSFDDFRDSWSQIALNMAEASVDYRANASNAPPLLVSVVTSETALRNGEGLAEFLDALSSLDSAGFYLLVQRNGAGYQTAMDPRAMENLLYCIYVLGSLNGYEVVVGYSDWLGFMLEAAGATATASGWHQSLRRFSMARFQPATGGRRPRKRYSSLPLLSNVLIIPEMEDLYIYRMINEVLTGGVYDDILRSGPAKGEANWSDEISCIANWEALQRASDRVAASSDIRGRIEIAGRMIERAESLYLRLQQRGVPFEPQTGPGHLSSWRDALEGFRAQAGLR